jgi:pseudouridine synthase
MTHSVDKNGKLSNKAYTKEMRRLQAELCKLQDWVKYKGLRAIVVFEGRDAAGKGGTIRAITERVSPRVFRLVLTEGRNRQIRRMCEALELGVKKLVRVRVMNIELGDLRLGRWRKLRAEELRELEARIAAAPAAGGSALHTSESADETRSGDG